MADTSRSKAASAKARQRENVPALPRMQRQSVPPPTAKQRWFLVVSALLLAIWLACLAWLAWYSMH